MKFLSTRTMPNEVAKHKNNANESAKQKEQWQKTMISTRTMTEDGAKHKNNAN